MAIQPIHMKPNISSSTSAPSVADTQTKNIQNEIITKTQSLNRLVSDEKISTEEKAKKRQELQKQIAELNRQLRMLRLEKEEETKKLQDKQEKKATLQEEQKSTLQEEQKKPNPTESEDDFSDENSNKSQDKTMVSPQNVQKFLEAGTALQRDMIQNNVAQRKDSSENTLRAEIKSDKLYGTDTSSKKEKLSEMIHKKPFKLQPKEVSKSGNSKTPMKIVIKEDDFLH